MLSFDPRQRPDEISPVHRDNLVTIVARCVYIAARHAAENCGGYGEALVEARLGAPRPLRLYFSQMGSFVNPANEQRTAQPPLVARGTFTIESLLEPQGVLEATRVLVSDFVHAMGSAEVFQIAPGGDCALGTGSVRLRCANGRSRTAWRSRSRCARSVSLVQRLRGERRRPARSAATRWRW